VGRQVLGVMVEGEFDSWFKGKTSPLVVAARKQAEEVKEKGDEQGDTSSKEDKPAVIGRVLGHSPNSARIILISSNTFLADTSLELASGAGGTRYLNPLQLMANCIDWSLEDRDLLSIRGHGHFARTLVPMSQEMRVFWEYLNYGLAACGLLIVWLVRKMIANKVRTHELALLSGRLN